jgi:hypothetical protein
MFNPIKIVVTSRLWKLLNDSQMKINLETTECTFIKIGTIFGTYTCILFCHAVNNVVYCSSIFVYIVSHWLVFSITEVMLLIRVCWCSLPYLTCIFCKSCDIDYLLVVLIFLYASMTLLLAISFMFHCLHIPLKRKQNYICLGNKYKASHCRASIGLILFEELVIYDE